MLRSIMMAYLATALATGAGAPLSAAPPRSDADEASAKAEAALRAMRPEEKLALTHSLMPLPIGPNPATPPPEAITGAGYVAGIPRLGIPALTETDASLGIGYVFGLRKDGATALPSGLAQGATWNPDMVRRGGATIGFEARAKGFNVLLGGGANLMRDPRNGRTFEYFSEDPLLTGILVGNAIQGIQSNNIISTIKHYALNGQETGRKFVNVKISDAAARESDLLAFQLGIEIGRPGAVMCAYNLVNDAPACASDYLLNTVLKRDWRYKGYVMSDWGAVTSLDAALKGLDHQSAAEYDPARFFEVDIAKAAKRDPRYARRLDDMNRRILWAIYANGLDKQRASRGAPIDFEAHGQLALEMAKQGIVLLRNRQNALPLARTAKSIVVIGGYADTGVLSGGGSTQVHGQDGPAALIPIGGDSGLTALSQQYHRSAPLAAIRKLAPAADVKFRDGRYVAPAVHAARSADVAIIFATKWSTEGIDQPDLTLPSGQDALIEAVAAANPNTIVVLETGNPVLMPWLDKTAAVIEAWYPGARGGEAIASVLFGETNPSGRLPVTFPAAVADLPRPELDGMNTLETNFVGSPPTPDAKLSANYDIEGSDIGYRWNARTGRKALFPFGFGLSYTSFSATGLSTDGRKASFTVKNIGKVAGATVAQLYLVNRGAEQKQRLVGFARVQLDAGESRMVDVSIDPRLLADWGQSGWSIPAGNFGFALGENAERLGPVVTVRLPARAWKD
ncbi:glycoside hydrolase family 3 C-terminal domain-containing protein [Sphingobium sp. HBC34]|uniref:Glycoside hydrolase family 3 C-terminal domain-containing protein n=1 Tax=Sphingobium cyanobacteriorum TaxID=3063954 RepID=A0ABT8ZIV4_9SPHN|nr:glycoside hydrolase family 3 C-terminal domain-containing protein [Sphingobium sp. HBC34]MDO7834141.1 glycoside hydrolase family 3 C-terminal domain-containing protein [Sphingobium sp. HBC34]